MKIFDTHTHYLDSAYDEDRDDILKKIYSAGVEKVCMISAEISDYKTIPSFVLEYNSKNKLKKEYPDFYFSVGIHPDEIPPFAPESEDGKKLLETFKNIAKNDSCVAIGEIGLDYFGDGKDESTKDKQKQWFLAQIELATQCNLPIVIHSRDAANDTWNLLSSIKSSIDRIGGIMHCYSYDKEMAKLFMTLNIFFGIGGVVTFSNAKKLKEALQLTIPIERVVIETDCPYLTPSPYRGTRNDSSRLEFVINALNSIYCKNVEEIVYANAIKVYQKVVAK